MATYTKHLLSASTGGTPILAGTTFDPGTTIHTTGTSDTVIDEIWLYAHNRTSTDATLTIEYGTQSADYRIVVTVTGQSGLMLAVPGLLLTGNGQEARTVSAFASASSAISITGYVNRIS